MPIEKLAVYEAPFIVDDTRGPLGPDFLARIKAHIGADRRSDALRMFMKAVGMPGFMIAVMRLTPVWKKLKAVAPTLRYDMTIVTPHQVGEPLPAGWWDGASMPVLAIGGGKSDAWMQNAQRAIADVLPTPSTAPSTARTTWCGRRRSPRG